MGSWSSRKPNLYTDSEIKARQRVVKLLDYYRGIQLSYLRDLIDSQFEPAEANGLKLQMGIRNITKYITDSLASTFKNGVLVSAVNENDQEIYDTIADSINLDNLMKTVEANVFLCKTVYVKLGWSGDKVVARILTPEYVVVQQDPEDAYNILSITYPQFIYEIVNYMPQGTFNNYTATGFNIINEKSVPIINPKNPNNENPYGVIPITVFQEKTPNTDYFYQFPGEDLINAQESVNVLLTERNQMLKMQAWSQPVLHNPSNMNVNDSKQQAAARGIKVGLGQPMIFFDQDKDVKGSFEFVSPNAKITDIENSIEKEMIAIASLYGVNPSQLIQSADAKSAQSVREGNAMVEEYRYKHSSDIHSKNQRNVFNLNNHL